MSRLSIFIGDEPKSGALKKQDRYGREPWRPGEIPTRGSLISVYNEFDQPLQPRGEFLGVQLPADVGKGFKKEQL